MQNPSLSSLNESIEDKPDGLAAVLLGPSVLLTLRNSELLPLLEESCNIKVPHSFNDLFKLLDATFLEQRESLDLLPNLTQPVLLVLLDDLGITTPQHQSNLRAQVPFLARTFAVHKLKILVQDRLFHSERLQEFGHLLKCQVYLSHLLLIQDVLSSLVFGSLDSYVLLIMLITSHLKTQLSSNFLHYTELERVLTPSAKCLFKTTMLRHTEIVCQNTLGVSIKVVFSCNHSNPLEDFDSQGAAGNSSNYIDCVTLATDVFAPRV